MAGQNILGAASIAPAVVSSAQLASAEAAVYTVPASTSVKIATASICNVTGSSLPPVVTLGTTATSGGTFAAAAYFWKVTARSSAGETLPSNEVTATLAANGTQVLNWAAVPGATSYNIYRGVTTGNENTLVANVTGTTYTDTGITGTGGVSLPTVNGFPCPVPVFLSIVNSGGTMGDGTHRIVNNYSLAANDTLDLSMLRGAMLGPGDRLAGFAALPNTVDFVVTGTVHA